MCCPTRVLCCVVLFCVVLFLSCFCLCLCLRLPVSVSWGGQGRAESDKELSSAVSDQQRSLPLMISCFDWDPSDPEHLAQTKPMPCRELCAHSSTSSTVNSGQLPRRPWALRQSDILNTQNIVHVQLETAEHAKLVAVT